MALLQGWLKETKRKPRDGLNYEEEYTDGS